MFHHSNDEAATSPPAPNGGLPFCPLGSAIFREFQVATEIRAASRDGLLLSSTTRNECEEHLRLAKRKYNDALVAWVTHRAFCVECRATSADKDLMEFASF
jgi:hypothetical protein